jgi:hypothetical protein
MQELLRTPHLHGRLDLSRRLVVVERSAVAFQTLAEMVGAFDALDKSLTHVRRQGLVLLIDTRKGPLRNDPEFERVFAGIRQRLNAGYDRIAVIVNGTLGNLQVERHARSDQQTSVRAFSSLEPALAYLEIKGGL